MTYIVRKNGAVYDLDQYGVRTRDFIVHAPDIEHETGKVDGADGLIDMGSTYGARNITCLFRFIASDWIDFGLMRDEVFNLFKSNEAFYLIEKRNKGKRWLVKVADPYLIPQKANFSNFDIEFISFKTYAESTGTTQDIERDGLNMDSDLWSFGMGLQSEEDTFKYKHTVGRGEAFKIYNAGDVTVHPFMQDMDLMISSVNGSNNYFELLNETNGTAFRTTEGVKNTQDLLISGATITSNGLQYLRKTNRGFIQLSPGMNYFTIDGASRATIEFDFRFYYY